MTSERPRYTSSKQLYKVDFAATFTPDNGGRFHVERGYVHVCPLNYNADVIGHLVANAILQSYPHRGHRVSVKIEDIKTDGHVWIEE